jgi:hypothetical protein
VRCCISASLAAAVPTWYRGGIALAQVAQNPSPMVDHTRAHRRLIQANPPPGRVIKLDLGELRLLGDPKPGRHLPLVVHFHGAPWVAQQSVAQWSRRNAAVIAIQIGSGSGVYGKAFADPGRFTTLLAQAETQSGLHFQPIFLTSFSAGYGAIRAILQPGAPANDRVDGIVLCDSLHSGYVGDKPGGPVEQPPIEVFLRFAREAAACRKQMVVTHSEVFPGTYASTTETAEALLDAVGAHRRPVLKWGPLGMQQVSEAHLGRFHLLGFAGNSAPDHVDHLHALAWWLKLLKVVKTQKR